MFLSIIASTELEIYSVYLQGNLFASALAGQSFSFYRFAISWILSSFGEVLTEEYANIFSRRIEEKMRTTLTKYCLDLYFSQNTFYSLKQIDGRILDPEQHKSLPPQNPYIHPLPLSAVPSQCAKGMSALACHSQFAAWS